MRLVGIIAIFVLSVTSIVEGAFLIRLSGKVQALADKVSESPTATVVETDRAAKLARAVAANQPLRMAATPPDPKAPEPAAGEAASTSPEVVGQALETAEGRAHLKSALDKLHEQERQTRLIDRNKRDIERDQREQERLARTLQLGGGEQGAIRNLYTNLQGARQRILDEMKTGAKSSNQADDEIDALEDQTEKSVRALLGENRMNQLREARRAERQVRRQERLNQRAARNGQPAPQ